MDTSTRVRDACVGLAVVYGVLLAMVGLWPRHVDAGLSVADWSATRAVADLVTLRPEQLVAVGEVAANAVLFVPLGLVVAFWWPRATARRAAVAGLSIAFVIEVVQWLAPVDRTPSVVDLVANTLGACVGFATVRVAASRPRLGPPMLGSLGAVVLAVLGVLVWGLIAGL